MIGRPPLCQFAWNRDPISRPIMTPSAVGTDTASCRIQCRPLVRAAVNGALLGFEAGISRGAASQHLSAISTASVSARCDGRRLISCRGGDTQQLAHTARPDPCVEDRRGHQPHNVQTATETPPGRSESGISTLMPAAVAADFHPRKKEEKPGLNSPSYLRQACGIWPAIVKQKGRFIVLWWLIAVAIWVCSGALIPLVWALSVAIGRWQRETSTAVQDVAAE